MTIMLMRVRERLMQIMSHPHVGRNELRHMQMCKTYKVTALLMFLGNCFAPWRGICGIVTARVNVGVVVLWLHRSVRPLAKNMERLLERLEWALHPSANLGPLLGGRFLSKLERRSCLWTNSIMIPASNKIVIFLPQCSSFPPRHAIKKDAAPRPNQKQGPFGVYLPPSGVQSRSAQIGSRPCSRPSCW